MLREDSRFAHLFGYGDVRQASSEDYSVRYGEALAKFAATRKQRPISNHAQARFGTSPKRSREGLDRQVRRFFFDETPGSDDERRRCGGLRSSEVIGVHAYWDVMRTFGRSAHLNERISHDGRHREDACRLTEEFVVLR